MARLERAGYRAESFPVAIEPAARAGRFPAPWGRHARPAEDGRAGQRGARPRHAADAGRPGRGQHEGGRREAGSRARGLHRPARSSRRPTSRLGATSSSSRSRVRGPVSAPDRRSWSTSAPLS